MFAKILCLISLFGACVNAIPLSDVKHTEMSEYFSERIVGGHLAPVTPHMAALVVGDMFKMLVCGASIVSPNLILTAAHCIDVLIIGNQIMETAHAIVGSTRWNSGGTAVYFRGFNNYPEWDFNTIKNDIGFLVTAHSMEMSETVAAIPMSFDWIEEGEPCSVTGWGRLSAWGMIPYDLQKLYLSTINPQECVNIVHQLTGGRNQVDPKVEICTYHSIGHGMCNGDSGSGLVSTVINKLIAIVSWGFPCAVGAPDMFVRVSAFEHFTKDMMKKYH